MIPPPRRDEKISIPGEEPSRRWRLVAFALLLAAAGVLAAVSAKGC